MNLINFSPYCGAFLFFLLFFKIKFSSKSKHFFWIIENSVFEYMVIMKARCICAQNLESIIQSFNFWFVLIISFSTFVLRCVWFSFRVIIIQTTVGSQDINSFFKLSYQLVTLVILGWVESCSNVFPGFVASRIEQRLEFIYRRGVAFVPSL